MSGCGCESVAPSASRNAAQRRILWTVLGINVVLFAGEFGAGWWAQSTALQADSLDSLGDAFVYGLSLAVVGGTLRARAGAALVKGGLQALFGLGILVHLAYRLYAGSEPQAPIMAIVAAIALLANATCFGLLSRYRGDDINMRSVWLCSRNDIVSNLGVILAAGAVAWTGRAWPDYLVGGAVALLFLHTSVSVLRTAWKQWRKPEVVAPMTCGAGKAAP
jgi:Co/Zn/Cd efflux system component